MSSDNMPDSPRPTEKRESAIAGFTSGLVGLMIIELIVGGALHTQYVPTPEVAYASVHAIQNNGVFGFLRAFHYWGSAVLILGGLVNLALLTLRGRFNRENAGHWWASCLLFLAAFLFQLSGNLTPFDKHGVQTAVIEAGITRSAPVGGPIAAQVMLGGNQFNDGTLSRWYLAHGLLLVVLGLLAAAVFWRFIRSSSLRAAKVWAILPPAAVVVLAVASAAPLGMAATHDDYNLYEASVSWYTWPMHGLMSAFEKVSPSMGWIGSVAIPTLLVALLLGAPLLSKKLKPAAIQGSLGVLAALFLVGALAFGGGFAPLTGNRDPKIAAVAQTAKPHELDAKLVARGKALFDDKGCNGCHGTNGAEGTAGPTLTGISKKRGTDPVWYTTFIKNPKSVKASSTMPAFDTLKEEELRAMAEFLISLK